jgi:16S rRNA G966 N2-methylase RsmD
MPKSKRGPGRIEDALTVALTQELLRQGLDTTEQAQLKGKGRGWADILVKLGRLSIIVEAKSGQDNASRTAALADCIKRLENGHCTAAVAVCYPLGTTISNFRDAMLDYAILDMDNQDPEWLSGTPQEFGNAIKLAPAQLGNADLAASQLRGELDKVLPKLSIRQKQDLARALDLPTTPIPKKKPGVAEGRYAKAVAEWETDKYDTAAIRGCLVIASAMMFHSRLDQYLGEEHRPEYDARKEKPTRYTGDWPPNRLSRCKDATDIVAALGEAWDTILALDYKPVFQTAIAGLKAPNDDKDWRDSLKIIADAAGNLTANLAGGRQDVMGRIFHRVLDTAPYDGSYYTGTAGATLLATLAIRPGDRDWNSLDDISGMNVTDPACGTGTLPIAAASRIRELADKVDQNKLSEILVEKVLHLYDVNLTATHMAATTMGLMSPSTQFGNMNVHRTRLGPPQLKQGQPVLPAQVGSLEWLDTQPTMIRWPEYKASEQIETKIEKAPRLAQANLFIMNPPFARDSLRYDQFTEEEEKAIKQREDSLLQNTAAHRSGGTHGFTVLAQRHLKQDGRMASVFPIVMAQAKSALPIRQSLGKEMHVEYVVALKDPEGMAFSENTTIGEMLVIARKWQKGAERGKATTTFVKILRKPKTPAQSKFMGEAILRGDSHPDYAITHWPQDRMEKGDWFPTQFVRDELVETFESIAGGQWFPVSLGKTAGRQGPSGRRIRDAFNKGSQSTPRRALWNHESDIQRTMASKPDVYITAKKGKEHLADSYWEQRGRVMLPARLRTPNTRITSVLSEAATIGSAFVPYHTQAGNHDLAAVEKAAVAYLNSSAGITVMLGITSNKIIVYPNWSVDDWYLVPFPDWSKLTARQVEGLAETYDELCGRELEELRRMLLCDTRRQLDEAVAKVLGIPWDMMEQTRIALASEPAITGKTYTGDAMVGGLQ